jgi:chorismate dehydratase
MEQEHTRLRIGAVSYLNTKPLVYQLEQLAPQAELSFDLPSRLADDLATGQLDIALIPSIEYFQNPNYTIVSDACIGCRGPVLSVKLLSRVPMRRIKTLALDEGSRTSATLVRILLRERFGVEPTLLPLPIGETVEETKTDAVLLIGDRAIHPPRDSFVEQWDLGDQWCRWSELPFVFAMWVAREGVDVTEVESALSAARDVGVEHLEEIAEAEASAVNLSFDQCLSYLRDNLYFYLGTREQRGLELFLNHAQQLGLAPEESRLMWDDCKAS